MRCFPHHAQHQYQHHPQHHHQTLPKTHPSRHAAADVAHVGAHPRGEDGSGAALRLQREGDAEEVADVAQRAHRVGCEGPQPQRAGLLCIRARVGLWGEGGFVRCLEVWRSVRTAWGVSGPSRSVLISCVLGKRRHGAGLMAAARYEVHCAAYAGRDHQLLMPSKLAFGRTRRVVGLAAALGYRTPVSKRQGPLSKWHVKGMSVACMATKPSQGHILADTEFKVPGASGLEVRPTLCSGPACWNAWQVALHVFAHPQTETRCRSPVALVRTRLITGTVLTGTSFPHYVRVT